MPIPMIFQAPTQRTSPSLKDFYADFHDRIAEKRFHSPYPIRRAVHREMYERVLDFVKPGMMVLDAGCGDGVLALMMAEKGAKVVGVDYSAANIRTALARRAEAGVGDDRVLFLVGDAEVLPIKDATFDLVVSNHVLEHLPSFERGLSEIHRCAKNLAVCAVPTCLSPYAWSLLGGGPYWAFGKRALVAFPLGFLRVIGAALRGQDGVNEGYVGRPEVTHIFRFPKVVRRLLSEARFQIVEQQPQAVGISYLLKPLRSSRMLRALKDFGVGTVFLVSKQPGSQK